MSGEITITLSDGITTIDVNPLELNGPSGWPAVGNTKFSFPRQIATTSSTNNHFKLVGDLTSRFVAGFTFNVENSAGGLNDGTYTVAAGGSSYTSGDNLTTIPVAESISTQSPPFGRILYEIPSAEVFSSLTFPGTNYVNWGTYFIHNFAHLLENFANATAPVNPIAGQLWYDTANNDLKVYTGSGWDSVGGLASEPKYDIQTTTGGATYTVGFDFNTPNANRTSLMVFVNGTKQIEGGLKDYTINAATDQITFNAGQEPPIGQDIEFYGFN